MNWLEAWIENQKESVFNEEAQASISLPHDGQSDFVLRLEDSYHSITAQGCDRMLEEFDISKTGWK